MNQRHLCISCMADWIDIDERMCAMCIYQHEQELKYVGKSRIRNDMPVAWWGVTEVDLDWAASDSEPEFMEDEKNNGLPWGYSLVEH